MKSTAFNGDYPITSPYGWRSDPFTGVRAFHNGIDVRTPMRTPIYANESGTVRISTKDSFGGLYVQIRLSNGQGYYQLHLDESMVKVGQKVNKGQLIAYSGNSGNSTGPHTHFGLQSDATVWKSSIDPTAFFTLVVDTPRFKKGDTLIFTDIQNIRKGSSTKYEIIRQNVIGEIFTIVDNPRFADGYTWYDTGNGWCADVNKFKSYIPPIPVPQPEPEPQPTPEPEPTPEPQPTPEPPTPPTMNDNTPTPPITPSPQSDTPEGTTEPKTFWKILVQFFTDLLQRILKSD